MSVNRLRAVLSGTSTRAVALRGTAAEMAGYASGMATRLISTLVLSRLLFPEAFGLSALVGITLQGLVMLSDVGLKQSIVQNARGDDARFLDTAFTLQAVRGVALWALACLLAWPLASVYGEPQLAWLLPVGGLSVLVAGFASTSLFTLRRSLQLWRLTAIEISMQVVTLVVTCVWAYFYPTVWALVGGTVVAAVIRTAQSHFIADRLNRFCWDASARAAIVGFGKWIFASSALSFLSRQADRLLMGWLAGMGPLGVYGIAYALSDAVAAAVLRVTHGVLFPLFSKLHREDGARLHETYYRVRQRMDAAAMIPVGALAVLAQPLVEVMYDPRYHEAGWMLSALCIRVAVSVVVVPVETYLFSIGNSKYALYQNIGRSVWMLIGIPLAWSLWGFEGIVWLVAFSECPGLAILWWKFGRLGLLRLRNEAVALLHLGIGLLLGLALRGAWQVVVP